MSMLDRLAESRIVRSPPALTAVWMGGEDLECGDGAVVVEVRGHAKRDECSVGLGGGVRLRFEGACADGLTDGERVAVEVDLETGVTVGLEGGSGLGPEPGGGGGRRGSSRGIVGEHAGGFALGALDERGPLLGDHAGGGGERGGVLVRCVLVGEGVDRGEGALRGVSAAPALGLCLASGPGRGLAGVGGFRGSFCHTDRDT